MASPWANQQPTANHVCQNCGREFANKPGVDLCYTCGDEAPHGYDAGLDPEDDPDYEQYIDYRRGADEIRDREDW